MALDERSVGQRLLEDRILLAFAEDLQIQRGDAQWPAWLNAIARFPAAGDAIQRGFNGGFVIAERLQRRANFAFGVAVQPAQPGFLRRGLAREAVEFQQGQHIGAQRFIHALDRYGEYAVFTGFRSGRWGGGFLGGQGFDAAGQDAER